MIKIIIRKKSKLLIETNMVVFNVHAFTNGPEFPKIGKNFHIQNNSKDDVIAIDYVIIAQYDVISYINNQTFVVSEVRKDSPH